MFNKFLISTVVLATVGLALISESLRATVFCICCLAFTLAVECSVATWRGR